MSVMLETITLSLSKDWNRRKETGRVVRTGHVGEALIVVLNCSPSCDLKELLEHYRDRAIWTGRSGRTRFRTTQED